ncbi:asparaginase domain-containing protein [Hydrocarboniclastica marina]|uniref:Asparaginase n=1 Tax=Hydrocarboniclastica marina TaxID=2259620 RepID=A0A4P7XI36_9ALTE|nr:asparaginase domain-containing protein [Hydrocarboniclastica marina]QCF26716.1 asparaginase [Hydrocarboniclastica marina]
MLRIFTTGGTFDKVYFDANSEFQIGDSEIPEMLREANVTFDIAVESVLRKDSLELTDEDRQILYERVAKVPETRVLITHGTDTMVQTAQLLLADERAKLGGKTIVITGAMQPSRMRRSDAMFNLGFAVAAVQVLQAGVYLAMNGRLFDPREARKNVQAHRFEAISRKPG